MENKEIHLKDYIRLLKKRRRIVATSFIAVFSLTVLMTLATTPIYKASTKVLIEKNERSNIVTGPNYSYSSYDPEFYETQYQLITSTAVARKVVDLLVADAGFDAYYAKRFNSSSMSKEAKADIIAKMVRGGISVKPVKNSKIVDISYTSENADMAQTIANTVAKAYIEELLEMSMSSTQYTIQWMTKKAEEEREKLEKSERTMQTYMKDKNFVAIEDKVAVVPQKISEINSQLIRAEAKRKETEALYNKVRGISSNLSDAEAITAVASDPTVQSLRQQILKAEQQNMEMSQKFGPKHPSMVRAQEDLKGLKSRRDQEIRRVINSIKNEYEIARSNEASLRGLLSETNSEALNVNDKLIEYKVLSREAETNRQLYDALIKRIKEQSINEQVRSANVLIVEKAEKPGSPISPRIFRNLFLGIIIGLLGGVGAAFFVEYLDQTIKTPEEAEAKLGVSVLGMIPLLKPSDNPVELTVLREPISVFAENYKAIRTGLLLSSADRPPKRLLITSSQPEEGKTATAINLATAIAQSEYSVLLVDADLRKPRVYKALGLNNSRGLSTYLAGASDMNIIQEGPLPNLSIITSGPIPPNPSELLTSNRLNFMINALSDKFDIIIFDAPPLLSVTDSLILSKVLDGTLVVARAGKTTYDDVRKSLKSLVDLKAHVLGLVINALDAKKNEYYYRYQSYYTAEEEAPDSKNVKA